MTKATRGNAASDRQLSKLQQFILLCIYYERTYGVQDRIRERSRSSSTVRLSDAIKEENEVIAQTGISWSSKLIFGDGESPTKAQTASISRALHRLEARGLVILLSTSAKTGHKLSHTTHVKLTKAGRSISATLYYSWRNNLSTSKK